MDVESFLSGIRQLGIETVVGVPDSTLKHFCAFVNHSSGFFHFVAPNEGAAVGLAIGVYLSTGKPACVYMQNSGLGNAVNPVTSLAHKEIYDIPMLFVVGWRGEPGSKDEPQHKFMGSITEEVLALLEIDYAIITKETNESELNQIYAKAASCLLKNRQFAIIVKRGTFEGALNTNYSNNYTLVRERVINEILNSVTKEDIIISTTGKISREVYEGIVARSERKGQAFLTIGGMGHASMIAFGMARNMEGRKVYCLDGDGAILMHMGSLAFLAKENPRNLVHICLNNDAHESVGGMPSGAVGADYSQIARACGYPNVFRVFTEEELRSVLTKVKNLHELCFVEILVALSSRADLERPQGSTVERKMDFMRYHGVVK